MHALPAMMSASTGGKVDGINGESGERVAPRVSCWCALMTTWMVAPYTVAVELKLSRAASRALERPRRRHNMVAIGFRAAQ